MKTYIILLHIIGNCFTHTNITSFTFYNDFIIKSKNYKKAKCFCFHFVKFTFFYIFKVSMRMRLFAHATLPYVSEQNTRISTTCYYRKHHKNDNKICPLPSSFCFQQHFHDRFYVFRYNSDLSKLE